MTRKINSNTNYRYGAIRKKTVESKVGKTYTSWVCRVYFTDPDTGKRKEKSLSGKSKHDVQQKLNVFIRDGQSVAKTNSNAPSNQEVPEQTLAEWLKKWESTYLSGVTEGTKRLYVNNMRLYIIPALGNVPLSALNREQIQRLYNGLAIQKKQKGAGTLSHKTRKDIAGAFHKALQKAIDLDMIPFNPADKCDIPKEQTINRREMNPLDKHQLSRFLGEIKGHVHEYLYFVDVFTGMRQGEILGLTWDCVDFDKNTIYIEKQQSKIKTKEGKTVLSLPKNNKKRTIVVALAVMEKLRLQQEKQLDFKLSAGGNWNNEKNLVFTNKTGGFLSYRTVYDCFKRVVKRLGYNEVRFHDLRHTYATMSLQNGDDIKTLSVNMGHFDVAFTLRVYGHSNLEMKQACANNMQGLISEIANKVKIIGKKSGKNHFLKVKNPQNLVVSGV